MSFLLLNFIRWLFGYIFFELKGGYPEKFINLAVKENINLWDLKKENGDLTSKVMLSDYEPLISIAKKANSSITVKEKEGLPVFTSKYKKRIGFLAGALIFIMILYFFSMYVWSVKVTGNDATPTAEIIKTMEELGVSPGSLKRRIDAPMVEHLAMIKLNNVAWMSVNINGSHVDVLIKEKVKIPEIFSEGEPCNVIASEDGQIERIETYKGTPLVKTGDVVTEGQLLISGVTEGVDAKSTFVDAEGKIFAKTRRKIKEVVKLSSLKAVDTGKIIKRYRIKTFGLEIPIGLWRKIDDNFRSEVAVNSLKIFSTELPIKIYTESWYEQECNEVTLTSGEAKAEAERKISEREATELSGAQVLDKIASDREENGECIAEMEYSCIDNISKKEPISFE